MLSGEQRAVLEPLVETCRPIGKASPQDLRRMLSAILWWHQIHGADDLHHLEVRYLDSLHNEDHLTGLLHHGVVKASEGKRFQNRIGNLLVAGGWRSFPGIKLDAGLGHPIATPMALRRMPLQFVAQSACILMPYRYLIDPMEVLGTAVRKLLETCGPIRVS